MIVALECSRLLAWLLVVMTLTAPLAATAPPGGATATLTGEQLAQLLTRIDSGRNAEQAGQVSRTAGRAGFTSLRRAVAKPAGDNV